MKRTLVILAVIALIVLPLWVFAQQGKTPAAPDSPGATTQSEQPQGAGGGMGHHHMEGEGHQGMKGKGHHQMKGEDHQMMMEKCKSMGAKHDKMQEEFKAMDAALDEKVAAMNAAKGDQKTAAMASVISEMATQRKQMHEKMADLHRDRMMCMQMGGDGGTGGHAGHGMMGGMGGGMGGMGGCPMMKEKGGMQHGGGGSGMQHGEGTEHQSGKQHEGEHAGGGQT